MKPDKSLWQKLLKKLQSRPQKILRRNVGLDHLVKHATTEWRIRYIINRFTFSEPIFLLLECFGRSCSLSRLRYPKRRNQLIKKLYATSIPKNSPLVFISYGSGALLQDVIFLAHLIPFTRPSSIAIHFIDPMLEHIALTSSPAARSAQLTQTERCNQFERWIHHTFPAISSNIFYHKDLDAYLAHHNSEEHKSIIGLAVDVEHVPEKIHRCTRDNIVWFTLTSDSPDHVMAVVK